MRLAATLLLTTAACASRVVPVPNAAPARPPSAQVVAAPPVPAPSRTPISFQPGRPSFQLSIGNFGPCETERDADTHVSVVYCDRREAHGQEGVLFNFYLPGVWSTRAFTPGDVAAMIRDNVGADTVVESSFAAPDVPGGELAYHIFTTALYPDNQAGQVFFIKVSRVGSAVVSRIYSRMFHGAPEELRDRMREWLVRKLEEYGAELERLRVDEAWVPRLANAP